MACKFYLNKVVKKYEWTNKKHLKCNKSLQQEKDQNKQEKRKMNLKETAVTQKMEENFLKDQLLLDRRWYIQKIRTGIYEKGTIQEFPVSLKNKDFRRYKTSATDLKDKVKENSQNMKPKAGDAGNIEA